MTDLDELRHHWGEAYEITRPYLGTWLAQRRDGKGEVITRETAEELIAAIRADYQRCPVSRDAGNSR